LFHTKPAIETAAEQMLTTSAQSATVMLSPAGRTQIAWAAYSIPPNRRLKAYRFFFDPDFGLCFACASADAIGPRSRFGVWLFSQVFARLWRFLFGCDHWNAPFSPLLAGRIATVAWAIVNVHLGTFICPTDRDAH
jgi:hypothetical protein